MDNAGVYLNWGSKVCMAYLSLCNLVVMVRKLEVHPPSVDVSLLAQDITSGREVGGGRGGGNKEHISHGRKSVCLPCHDGALDVPARPPLPPGARPPWLSWFAGFPEGKVISGTLLTQSVGRNTESSLSLSQCLHVSHCLGHQFGIGMVRGGRELYHVKVDRPIGHIAGREEGEKERS